MNATHHQACVPRRSARVATALLAIVAAGTLAACASVQHPSMSAGVQPTQGNPPAAFAHITDWKQIRRPIDRYLPTADEEVALTRLGFSVATTCLASHGYKRIDAEPADYPAFVRGVRRDLTVRSDVYGFFDTDTVGKFGYLRPPTTPGHVMVSPPNSVPDGIFRTCQSAGVRVTGPADQDQLPKGGPALATNDPRVVAAKSQWARCMSTHGYDIADPISAISDHQRDTASDKAIAQTDVACKSETNFVGIATGVQAEMDNAYIAANKPALDSYKATVAALLRPADAMTPR
ncbi:MAG: hypothetical protein QOK10_1190 [Pseudonocardiales bacterium]|nr:hypothetical protein [Pseudonocardiales bacterium]